MAGTRRLAAIMFTDTVGYTASTQTDEAGTLALLDRQRQLVRPIVAAYHGREIKSTGDGFLVEFNSALKATQCAVDIQRQIQERNAQAGFAPIRIRIGIHLGDVEQQGDDIFGDAVNIAARIEPVAEPGGICVSSAVYEQVRNKIPDRLERLPPRELKGLQGRMEIYRVLLPWDVREVKSDSSSLSGLAVLPFANISPDAKDDYFADGLTEELITVLSQLPGLRVIARTSVIQYKNTSKAVSQIGNELGVSSVLEGSVRKAGNRLRITAQLIDAGSQSHLWANSYDRDLDDIFALQSEMAKHVAEALKVKLLSRDTDRLDRRGLPRPDSYLEFLKGRASLQSLTEASLRTAQEHFERAIELDDRNAAAHAGLSDAHRIRGPLFRHTTRSAWEDLIRRHASRAIELDPDLPEAHSTLGQILSDDYEYAAAEREFQLALSTNPSLAWARLAYGDMLADLGRTDEALREFALADQLDPFSSIILTEHIALLVLVRHLDEAEILLERLGRVDDFGVVYHNSRGYLSFARGNTQQNLQSLDSVSRLLPGRPEIAAAYAMYSAWIGEADRARELLRPIEILPESVRPFQQIAMVHARLADLDGCFRWLNRAVDVKSVAPRLWRLEPSLAHVRADPRFPHILTRMNLA